MNFKNYNFIFTFCLLLPPIAISSEYISDTVADID